MFCKYFKSGFLVQQNKKVAFGKLKKITHYEEELRKIQYSWKLNLELSSQKLKPLKITKCAGMLGLYSLHDFL